MSIKKLSLPVVFSISSIIQLQAQTPVTPPAAYQPTVNVNYVREWSPTAPITDASVVPTRVIEEVKTNTSYLDGLGRPLQSVSKQASPNKKDLVNATVYDALGKETYKYLPFISSTTSGGTEITDNGSFKLNPFQQQQTFMNAQYGAQGETFYYGQTDFESSPLNRSVKSFAPGNSWVGSRGSTTTTEKSVQQQYLFNTTNDAVKIFNIAAGQGSLPTSSANYSQGELTKNVSIDERNRQQVEFKDKEGHVLLKKIQAANTVTDGPVGWLSTYYVYDDFGQLRFVLPPKATEIYLGGTAISNFADELCFRYEYDSRHRVIIKKVPGAAEIWMVYDVRDRLVMKQDGNLRATGQWLVTIYDLLNREIQTGLLTDANTLFTAHQSNASTSINYPSTVANFMELTQSYYDDYSWVASSGTTLSSTIDASNLNNNNYFITTYNSGPYYALPLIANYFTKGMVTGKKVKVIGATSTQFIYNVLFYDEKGRTIQTQSINMSSGKDIITTQYDFNGKPLRSLLQHNKAGTTSQSHIILTKIEYDHLGRALYIRKQITSTVNGQTISSPEKAILQNSYDELGQLKTKKIGNKPGSITELETLSYDYNIRGWLLGVNRSYINSNNTDNYFGFELAYDKSAGSIPGKSYTAAQFNGNIAGTEWKSKGDGVNRQYDYTYDNVNRLLRADFKQVNPLDNSWNNNIVNYDVIMGDGSTLSDGSIDYTKAYDANGNIKQMQQWGLKINASTQIDNLVYNYSSNGSLNTNKLLNVIDWNNDNTTTLGDFRASTLYQQTTPTKTTNTIDYTYDVNGNLTKDRNKDIEEVSGANGIQYNSLNLPWIITVKKDAVNNKGTITFIYDASGNKLQKITSEPAGKVIYSGSQVITDITTTTDYICGFVYESKFYSDATVNSAMGYTSKLQFAAQEEGRIRPTYNSQLLTGFSFDYMIKDHLGNTRMVLTDEAQLDHYPTATLEANAVAQEQKYYDINTSYVVTNPPGLPTYTNDNGTNNPIFFGTPSAPSQKMYRLNAGNANRSGLNMVLKVMAGDQLDILAKSYYQYNSGTVSNTAYSVTDVLNSFFGTAGGANAAVSHGGTTSILNTNINGTVTPINSFLNNSSNTNPNNNVKAGLCYILFDEQFNYVAGGFDPVNSNTNGGIKSHLLQGIPVKKNGYIYIYVSNESNIDVFFDNLEVGHARGAILEETHYYPFGLTMAGISSKAAGIMQNKDKTFQGQKFDDDLGLNWVEFKYRNNDPQIGRFVEIDPLSEKYEYNSTYAFSENKVTAHIELEGLEALTIHGKQNHHAAKDFSEATLDPSKIQQNSTSYGDTYMYPKGLGEAQSLYNTFSGAGGADADEVNQKTSVSETVKSTTVVIEDNPIGDGKMLSVSTTTKVTVATMEVDNVKAVKQTTTSSTVVYAVVGNLPKTNCVVVKAMPLAIITTPTTTSTDPNKVSPGLQQKINTAAQENREKMNQSMKNIEKTFDKSKDMFKPTEKN